MKVERNGPAMEDGLSEFGRVALQWPPPKIGLWNPQGEWWAALQPAANSYGWLLAPVEELAQLDGITHLQPRAAAVVAWSDAWTAADWVEVALLCHRAPTLIVGAENCEPWELLLRQFGAVGIFGSTLQAPSAVRLMIRLFREPSPAWWSLEELVESDLRWDSEASAGGSKSGTR